MTIYCEPFTQAKYRTTHQIHAVEKKCPVCGETFTYYSEHHAYKIRQGTNTCKVCSWHCMRHYERTCKLKTGKGARQNWRRSVPDALERKAECEAKIALYNERYETAAGREKSTARVNLYGWQDKLADVNEYLRVKGVEV